jgi:hypothetical protein
MKKYFAYSFLFLTVIAVGLFATTKISDSHVVARRAIMESPLIRASIGQPKYIFLLGLSGKSDASSAGCNSMIYFVIGVDNGEFVNVRLASKDVRENNWTVIEMTEGYFTQFEKSCRL